MKPIQRMSDEEALEYHKKCLEQVPRYAISPIRDNTNFIRRLEDAIIWLDESTIKNEECEKFDPYLQSLIEDLFDMIDYVKKLQ